MKNFHFPGITLPAGLLLVIAVILLFAGFLKDGHSESSSGAMEMMTSGTFPLPDSLDFAGEKVPLGNFDTRESLEREIIMTAYRHGSTIMIIKRSARYFPEIDSILKENGIPGDFRYVAVAESELSNMVSPAGATGFWQIMQGTGKEHGLEINNEVDERYNLARSTKLACDYFRKSYERYGNWTLAAASYNGGRNAIDEQIAIQKQNNYYDLLLADETARYVFRILAYKIIMTNPAAYGFDLQSTDLYPPLRYTEVKVDTAVSDFAQFAAHFGTTYKNLKFLNPWLRKPYLTKKSNRSYLIRIPEEGSRTNIY